MPKPSIDYVCNALNADALRVARAIVPDGRLRGHQYWMRNPRRPDGGNFHTFSVNVSRGLWKDFSNAGGDGGDMFKFVAMFACAGDYKRAWRWALDYLGLTGKEPDPAEVRRLAQRRAKDEAAEAAKLQRLRAYCMHLWLEAKPLRPGDPPSEYLRARGIDVQACADGAPTSLRYHPRIDLRTSTYLEDGRHLRRDGPFDAMVAHVALEGLPHGLATVHVTALECRDGCWRKAARAAGDDGKPLSAKEVFCAYGGGSIRLTKGKSGKPLSRAPDGEWLLMAEGIENALSAAIAEPEERVIAAVSIANMASVRLPASVAGVTILADNDDPGNNQAQQALDRAQDALAARGYDVAIARVPSAFKDFNAALQGLTSV